MMKTTGNEHLPNILLVDDNESEQILVQRAFRKSNAAVNLFVVGGGAEALQFLRNEGCYADTTQYPRPELILLDINMPVMDGKHTLKAIRADHKLRMIPVVMLTTSNSDSDVSESYRLGANAFVVKPVNAPKFAGMIDRFLDFWLNVVILPPQQHSSQ